MLSAMGTGTSGSIVGISTSSVIGTSGSSDICLFSVGCVRVSLPTCSSFWLEILRYAYAR